MKSPVRVRFAPSPTGHLHIGSLRTALFNWLFARHHKGVFLLRIEDTDVERSKSEYTESIMGSLAWCGLEPDEPVVIQSARITEHQRVAQQLIEQGKAYRCICTPGELEQRLKSGHSDDLSFTKYDGTCRNAGYDATKTSVIRFKIDVLKDVSFNDIIRGHISVNTQELDDFIIVRSDGTPMYNFVVVVDDAFMRITHVIRGEDHISNTIKQILLYQACEYELPEFAHLPMILGPSGEKLSKRDGAVSALDYRHNGYLADALINYLARLGWAHGDQEIFTREELIGAFTLEAVSKKGAIFDVQKLNWVNAVFIRATDDRQLLRIIETDVQPGFRDSVARFSDLQLCTLIGLYKQRMHTLAEIVQAILVVYHGPQVYNADDIRTWIYPVRQLLPELKDLIGSGESTDLSTNVKEFATQKGIKLVALAQPLRIALLGTSSGPGVFDLIEVVGTATVCDRLEKLINYQYE